VGVVCGASQKWATKLMYGRGEREKGEVAIGGRLLKSF
jgi:hypothetical protein